MVTHDPAVMLLDERVAVRSWPDAAHTDTRYWLIELDLGWHFDVDATLSAPERAKASRFHQPRHALRYSRGRWALRHILSGLTDQAASQLRLGEGPQGKPNLPQHPGVFFNVSHCQQWALIATSSRAELGVDIEQIRPLQALDGLMLHTLTSAEQAHHEAHMSPDPSADLLRVWTRKEACLKAVGAGLHADPSHLDLLTGLMNGTHTATLHHDGAKHALAWHDIALPPDCHAMAACAWTQPG